MTVATAVLDQSQRKDLCLAHLPLCTRITNHKQVYSVVWCVRFSQAGVQAVCMWQLQLQLACWPAGFFTAPRGAQNTMHVHHSATSGPTVPQLEHTGATAFGGGDFTLVYV